MSIVYTVNGFPSINKADQSDSEVRYHDEGIDTLYHAFPPTNKRTFADELAACETAIKAWKAAGCLFTNLLQPGVKVSASVTSFVLETAAVVVGGKSRRGLSFQDWALLLQPGDDIKILPVEINAESATLLKQAAELSLEHLIQQWVMGIGLEDLIATMKLYVGTVQKA